jgi:hypothetical protein
MSSAGSHVGILHGDCLPPPINLAHDTRADVGALRFVNVAVYVKPGMPSRQSITQREASRSGVALRQHARSDRAFACSLVACTRSQPAFWLRPAPRFSILGQVLGDRCLPSTPVLFLHCNFLDCANIAIGKESSKC